MRAQLLAMKLGRLDEAQATSEAALRLIEEREGVAVSLVRSDALNVQGWVFLEKRDWPKARITLETSLNIRQTLQDYPRIAASLANLGPVLWRLNDSQAESVFQQCVELCERTEDVQGSARAKHNLAFVRVESGNLVGAIPMFQEAYHDQASIGDRFSMALTLVNVGAAEFAIERYGIAHQYYEQALLDIAPSEMNKSNAAGLNALVNLAEAALCLGNIQETTQTLDQLDRQLGSDLPRWENAVFYFLLRADLAAVQGEDGEVTQQLGQALTAATEQGDTSQQAEIRARLDAPSTHPWALWAAALTTHDPNALTQALDLNVEAWRRAYLYDALAASGRLEAGAEAQDIRARFTGPPDPFLQSLQTTPPPGRHP